MKLKYLTLAPLALASNLDVSKFYFSAAKKTWNDADAECTSKGMHLTSIKNKEQDEVISKAARDKFGASE
jgi:hypothetical protein